MKACSILSLGDVIINFLIQNQAKIDVTDVDGETALMHACRSGQLKYVNLLLDSGAKLELQTNVDSWTALMTASKWGHADIVQELVKRGADVNRKNSNGWTALMIACK